MAVIIDDIIVYAGIFLAVEGVAWGIDKWNHWRLGKKTKEFRVAPVLSDDDKALIEKCREVMKENFPEGIETKMKGMTVEEKMALFQKLVMDLNPVFGVNITNIAFLSVDEIGNGTLGYYDRDANSIRFNLDLLKIEDNPEIMRAMVDTIIHELRHALQHRAVTDTSFNYGTEDQRYLWTINFLSYIPAHVDFAYYQEQIVEADARLIAELSIKDF